MAKEKLLALGVYPDVSLSDARERRIQARKLIALGKDPGEAKKESKRQLELNAENSFETVAREWFEKRKKEWKANTVKTIFNRLENDILPKLGKRPVAEITAPEVLSMLRAIEGRGALDMAKRAMQTCGQVFMYAIATGRAVRNPVPDLKGVLETAPSKHRAYLKAAELPEFLNKLEIYDGHPETKIAMRFLMLTFVRTIELRAAEWSEVDLKNSEWRIPAARMKMKQEHIVPLSSQSVDLLKELKKYTGGRQYIFPNQQKPSGFMSENTILYALYRMGYHSRATGHGFRATASTILNEQPFQRVAKIPVQIQAIIRLDLHERRSASVPVAVGGVARPPHGGASGLGAELPTARYSRAGQCPVAQAARQPLAQFHQVFRHGGRAGNDERPRLAGQSQQHHLPALAA